MMETYRRIREALAGLARDAETLLDHAGEIPTLSPDLVTDWRATVARIVRQLDEEVLRVAVVGSIKSGKSTFVNALMGDEVTQRGAGVVTSIVTRIRIGAALSATLYFKSWDTVNADMRQALSLVSESGGPALGETFDIRNAAHRTWVSERLGRLGTDRLIRDGMRHPSAVLIQAYITGFDRASGLLRDAEEAVHLLSTERFQDHRAFTGNDALAVYLKDVRLEVPREDLDPHVEIADCQGSDSPNPLHLTMIQDYLVSTHLIVYVVSSRTGPREADIRFLSMIRNMGIMDNILFVINCDFNEHESIGSMKRLLDRNIQELALVTPDPQTYCFSCLYHLFKAQSATNAGEHLSVRDRERLFLWEKEPTFTRFSDEQSGRFMADFTRHLTRRRFSLLLNNHLSRLNLIAGGMAHAVALGKDLLSRDTVSAKAFQHRLADHHQSVRQLSHMVQSTLDGACETIKKRLRQEVDRLFDPSRGMARDAIEFIRGYEILNPPAASCTPSSDTADTFSSVCNAVFQEFRQALDTRMAESVNPFIVQSMREMETLIVEGFKTVAGPVRGMVRDAVSDYNRTLSAFDMPTIHPDAEVFLLPDLDDIKETAHLTLPPAEAVLWYSGRVRTEAVLRFGLYRLFGRIRQFFKKSDGKGARPTDRAIRDSLSKVKGETEAGLLSLFKDYRENLKFQYLFKLTDAVAKRLHGSISDGFRVYGADLEKALDRIGNRQDVKDATQQTLGKMALTLQEMIGRIDQLALRIRNAEAESQEKTVEATDR